MKKKIEEKILNLITESPQTISSIKRELKLDYKNAWRYCRRMYKEGIVDLKPNPENTKKGKPVYVLLKVKKTEREYLIKVLKEIKKTGKIDYKDFSNLLSDEPKNYMEEHHLLGAIFKLPYMNPPLIKREISLSGEGLKFLKEND